MRRSPLCSDRKKTGDLLLAVHCQLPDFLASTPHALLIPRFVIQHLTLKTQHSAQRAVSGPDTVALGGTRGIMIAMYSIKVETRFSSSHHLTGYEGNCARLHGHNWRVVVEVSGKKLNETGMLVDFTMLKGKLDEIASELDHIILNDHPYFKSTELNPTAENIAALFYSHLQGNFGSNRVSRVEVYETDDYVAAYEPD